MWGEIYLPGENTHFCYILSKQQSQMLWLHDEPQVWCNGVKCETDHSKITSRNFQDTKGPQWLTRTFQGLEIWQRKIQHLSYKPSTRCGNSVFTLLFSKSSKQIRSLLSVTVHVSHLTSQYVYIHLHDILTQQMWPPKAIQIQGNLWLMCVYQLTGVSTARHGKRRTLQTIVTFP